MTTTHRSNNYNNDTNRLASTTAWLEQTVKNVCDATLAAVVAYEQATTSTVRELVLVDSTLGNENDPPTEEDTSVRVSFCRDFYGGFLLFVSIGTVYNAISDAIGNCADVEFTLNGRVISKTPIPYGDTVTTTLLEHVDLPWSVVEIEQLCELFEDYDVDVARKIIHMEREAKRIEREAKLEAYEQAFDGIQKRCEQLSRQAAESARRKPTSVDLDDVVLFPTQ